MLDPVLYVNDFLPRIVKTALGEGFQYCLVHAGDRLLEDSRVGRHVWCGAVDLGRGLVMGYSTAVGTSERQKTSGCWSCERVNCDPL